VIVAIDGCGEGALVVTVLVGDTDGCLDRFDIADGRAVEDGFPVTGAIDGCFDGDCVTILLGEDVDRFWDKVGATVVEEVSHLDKGISSHNSLEKHTCDAAACCSGDSSSQYISSVSGVDVSSSQLSRSQPSTVKY